MGSPVFPPLAILFMANLEDRAISTFPLKPKVWKRYVDDIFVIWQHGRNELNNFFHHISSVNEKIKFTMKMEENGKLPFLDILLYRTALKKIGHTVYRKPTHTNRYLHANSHHHPSQLNGILKTLISRSKLLTDEEHLEMEIETLRNAFTRYQIDRVLKDNTIRQRLQDDLSNPKVILPYIKKNNRQNWSNITQKRYNTSFSTT